jgi:signal transduction histidine kinase
MTSTDLAVARADGRLSYEEVEHELKTPLTTIRSLAEILRDVPDLSDEERRLFVQRLADENERMAGVVERLLGYLALQRAVI